MRPRRRVRPADDPALLRLGRRGGCRRRPRAWAAGRDGRRLGRRRGRVRASGSRSARRCRSCARCSSPGRTPPRRSTSTSCADRGLADRISLVRDTPGCGPLFARADRVVQMAGYNSTFECLAAGVRPVLVPRRTPRREQVIRATRLAALGLADVVDEPASAAEVAWLLRRPRALAPDRARCGRDPPRRRRPRRRLSSSRWPGGGRRPRDGRRVAPLLAVRRGRTGAPSALGALLSLVVGRRSASPQPWPLRWIVDGVLDAGGDGGHPAERDHAPRRRRRRARRARARRRRRRLLRLPPAAAQPACTSPATLRVAVLDRLQRLSLRYHGRARVGDLVARVTSDVAYTQDMFVQVLATLLPSVLLVVGMFVVMLMLDPVFTLLALLATPPLVLATHRSRLQLRQASRARPPGRRRPRLGGDREPLVDPADPGLHARGRPLAPVPAPVRHEPRRRARGGPPGARGSGRSSTCAGVVSTAVVVWFGAQRVLDGRAHARRAAGVPELHRLAVQADQVAVQAGPDDQQGRRRGRADRRGARRADRHRRPPARPAGSDVRGTIELRDVSFSYGRGPVLDDLSLRVEAGRDRRPRRSVRRRQDHHRGARAPPDRRRRRRRARRRHRRPRAPARTACAARSRWSPRTPCCSRARCATTSSADAPASATAT